MRDGGCAERAFPVAANAHDGAMGSNGFHQTFTATAPRATTDLSNQRNEVSSPADPHTYCAESNPTKHTHTHTHKLPTSPPPKACDTNFVLPNNQSVFIQLTICQSNSAGFDRLCAL